MFRDNLTWLSSQSFQLGSLTCARIEQIEARLIQATQAIFSHIGQIPPDSPEQAKLLDLLLEWEDAVDAVKGCMIYAREMHTDKAVREASTKSEERWRNTVSDCMRDPKACAAIKAFQAAHYPEGSPQAKTEEGYYLQRLMGKFRANGVDLPEEERAKFKAISARMNTLCLAFEENLNEEAATFYLPEDTLPGLDPKWLEDRRQDDGTIKVTLKYPDILPILSYCDDRSTREKMSRKYEQRCAEANRPLVQELIVLRAQLAQMLGFENWAQMRVITENWMVGSAVNIHRFLSSICEHFEPARNKNLTDLERFAVQATKDPAFKLQPWDIAYYQTQREKLECDVDTQAISQYFPWQKVVSGTLAIYEKLFGLKFIETPSEESWDPLVKHYEVYDHDHQSNTHGAKRGELYLDLFPREGKFGHAACQDMIKGAQGKRETVACIICNFEEGGQNFDEVETFFHEFGHGVALLCGEQRICALSGFDVAEDFVEAPSQMLERWCYHPDVLAMLSEHPETKAPLPSEMAQKLVAKRQLHAGNRYMRQMYIAWLDHQLHTLTPEQASACDSAVLEKQLYQQCIGIETDSAQTSTHLGHLSGYDALYYSYCYTDVIASAMAERFNGNVMDPDAAREYRAKILAPAATKPSAELMQDFLKGGYDIRPFLQHYGVVDSKPALQKAQAFTPQRSKEGEASAHQAQKPAPSKAPAQLGLTSS